MKNEERDRQIQSRYIDLIESIVNNDLDRVDGVLKLDKVNNKIIKNFYKPVTINHINGALEIDIVIDVLYGKPISEMSCILQERIKHQIESKTKFAIRKINIHVQNVVV